MKVSSTGCRVVRFFTDTQRVSLESNVTGELLLTYLNICIQNKAQSLNMTMHKDAIGETIAASFMAKENMEYTDSKGTNDSRHKKVKRRRHHRKTKRHNNDGDNFIMPSVFGVQNDVETFANRLDANESSRLVLPKLSNVNQPDTRLKTMTEKQEEKHNYRHILPSINASGSMTTGSVTFLSGFEDGGYSRWSRNCSNED